MTYPQLIDHLQDNRLPDNDYYKFLLNNSSIIIEQIPYKSKAILGKELGMTPQVFSTALKYILAHNSIK